MMRLPVAGRVWTRQEFVEKVPGAGVDDVTH
jgi:hypothetical protein